MWLRSAAVAISVVLMLTGCASSGDVPKPATTGARSLSPQDEADLDAQLASAAEASQLTDIPAVERVRIVSQADAPQTQVDCLTAAGYPATLTGDGQGWSVELTGASDAYNLAAYTCLAQYPTDPAQSWSRVTEDQKRIAYNYLSVTLVQCLTDQGFTTGSVPTEEAFLATWDTALWNPYTDVHPAEEVLVDGRFPLEAWEAVWKACPMNTPPGLIWGG